MKLNKDGTPRKEGSGRTSGATSFVKIPLSKLNATFADKELFITCGRMWAEAIGLIDVPKPMKPQAVVVNCTGCEIGHKLTHQAVKQITAGKTIVHKCICGVTVTYDAAYLKRFITR